MFYAIIIVVVIVLAVGGYLLYKKMNSKPADDKQTESSVKEGGEIELYLNSCVEDALV